MTEERHAFFAAAGAAREKHPDAPCIADDSAQLTNAEFLIRVRAVSAALWRRGVGEGDVVAVMLPNRHELVVTLWRIFSGMTA